jgi:ABC-2 type transport system permease protein
VTGFAGTGQLARLAFRRDAGILPVCTVGIVAVVATVARDLKVLYPTEARRLALAQTAGGNPALRFLYGRLEGTSVGALVTWRFAVWAGCCAAVLTIFIVVRHTRADEEAGRLELVGSAAVGRQAPLTAALLAAVTANVAIILLTLLWLTVLKLPGAGSAAFALAIGTCGLAFTGVAAVAAQLASTARGARGLAIGVLGAAFVLRGVGDTGPAGLSWLSWASPLGWVGFARAFGAAGERWWVLAFPVAAGGALVGAAFALSAWRDHSAGLLPERPGRPAASGRLRGPFGLAWRLQSGVLLGWLAGYVAIFASLGAATKGVGEIFSTSAVLRRYFLRIGYQHTIIDAYLSAVMLLAGLGAAAFATSAVLRLRTDETGNLAELVLATATGRIRWALSYLSVAAALFGLLPWECTALAWGLMALVAFIAVLGPSLLWPAAIMDISPFTQVPKLPGGSVAAQPLVWLCGIAVALAAVGLLGLRRRDLGDLGPSHGGGRVHDWLVNYLRIDQNLGRAP